MSCEKNIALGSVNRTGIGVVGVSPEPIIRNVAAVVISETKQPHPYFEPTDWEVGGKNPFRDAVEARRQIMTEHPTFFSVWGNV